MRGVPEDRELAVRGSRVGTAAAADDDRWHSVWVELTPAEPVESFEVGVVLVDEARLLFTDPGVLNQWRTDEPIDGRVDIVLWGSDAFRAAEQLNAPLAADRHEPNVCGRKDLPIVDAVRRESELHQLRQAGTVRFAFDARPHDDHYPLLAQMRSSSTSSGTTRISDSAATGFFTTWGDGAFPVYQDIAADGQTCRFRVALAALTE